MKKYERNILFFSLIQDCEIIRENICFYLHFFNDDLQSLKCVSI
jgi:hypothetical protein